MRRYFFSHKEYFHLASYHQVSDDSFSFIYSSYHYAIVPIFGFNIKSTKERKEENYNRFLIKYKEKKNVFNL